MGEQIRRAGDKAEAQSVAEVADEANAWLVGGGIIITALFPLALPAIILVALAALPLIPIALAAGLVAAPVMLVRRLRKATARSRARSAAGPLPRSAHRPA